MNMQAFNPYLPSFEYIPDGEPYVFQDRVYVYGSHDHFNGMMYCPGDYVCWSAPVDSLGDWHYEGVIYEKVKDPMCDKKDERLLFAPDVQIGSDGRYYLYYAFDFTGVMAVAVCDSPAGSYEFYGHVHHPDGSLLGSKEGEAFQFDPGVLVDDDGSVFLYSGFCPLEIPWEELGLSTPLIKGGMVIELEKDMVTVKVGPKVIFPYGDQAIGTSYEGHEFFEAASIRKMGSKYYFVYSSINGHELCYATSDKPDGDFVFGGTIVSNGDIYYHGRLEDEALNYTGNNHGSIVEINEQWYVFYHRQTNRHQFSRQVCAEKIEIIDDGTIAQVEMTSCGLNNGPLRGSGLYEARIACVLMSGKGAKRYEFGHVIEDYHPYFTQEGNDREDDPNQYIANMTNGSVAGFKYFDIHNLEGIKVTVRGEGKGILKVSTGIEYEAIGHIELTGNTEWKSFITSIKLAKALTAVYFTFEGDGAIDFYSFELL